MNVCSHPFTMRRIGFHFVCFPVIAKESLVIAFFSI